MYDDDKIKALKASIENTEAKLKEVVERHTTSVPAPQSSTSQQH